MKMPSRYVFNEGIDPEESDRARQLHEEQKKSRAGGYKMVRVSARTHKLLARLKAKHGHAGEWSLDAILYQLLLQELSVNTNLRPKKAVDSERSSGTCIRGADPQRCSVTTCFNSRPPAYK